MSKCQCDEQQLIVQGSKVLCICPHFEPYRVYLENPLKALGMVKNGCLPKGTPFLTEVPTG